MDENFKDLFAVLKTGSANKVFPIHAAYLHSEDGELRTVSLDSYISIDVELPFNGDVNIFLLEGMLNKLGFENLNMSNKDNDLLLESNGFESVLTCIDANFPHEPMPSCHMFALEQRLTFVDDLRLAYKFAASEGSNAYVIVDDSHIIAQAEMSDPIFVATHDVTFEKAVGLTRNSLLPIGAASSIGISSGDQVVYEFGDYGYGFFTTYNMVDASKVKAIKSYANLRRGAMSNEIGSVSEFRDAVNKVLPIFYGEKQNLVLLTNFLNSDGVPIMKIEGRSMYNGSADYDLHNKCETEFKMLYDITNLKSVPGHYYIGFFPNDNGVDELVCYDENKIVITMGEPYERS